MGSFSNQVLITGAAGWLGAGLVNAFINGLPDSPGLAPQSVHVRALVLPGQEAALRDLEGKVEVISGDIRNPADCARFCAGAEGAVLFHTAGIIHPRRIS